jgi:hypothetical protein
MNPNRNLENHSYNIGGRAYGIGCKRFRGTAYPAGSQNGIWVTDLKPETYGTWDAIADDELRVIEVTRTTAGAWPNCKAQP